WAVGNILSYYDYDKLFPVSNYSLHRGVDDDFMKAYGFGGRIPPRNEVSHCFPLTLDPNKTEVYTVQVKYHYYDYDDMILNIMIFSYQYHRALWMLIIMH